jgi:PAS domain S-box-containing protein
MVQGIFRDITERKKAEDRYKGLMEETPIGILHVDIKGKLIYFNKKLEEILGYSKNEIVGKNWLNLCRKQRLMSEETIKIVFKRIKNKLMGRDAPPMRFPLRRKDGSSIWLEGYSTLIKKFGVPVGLQATLKDINEQKKIEEALSASEERYRSMIEVAPDGIITVDTKGVITSANNAFLRLTGYSQDEIVGIHFTKLGTLRARDIPKYLKLMSSVMRGKMPPPFEYSYVRKDGTVGWGEAHVGLQKRDGKTTGFLVLLREITGRKMAERATRESEEKFERLFIDNPEAAIYTDSEFHLLDVNPRFKELFGYSIDEIKGKHVDDVVVPKDKVSEAEMLNKKAKKGYVYHDTVRKKKDGSLVPVSISAAPITVEKQLVGYVAVYKDISQLKETLEKLETMNEKLRVVGNLTRHDARNKLSTVTMNTFLAKQKLTENHEALQHLSEVESAVGQVEGIFDFARIYEKLGMEELTYMGVEKTLEETIMLFSNLRGVKIVNDCHGVTVLADSLLRQLFYNMIDNSLKHGEKVSQIRIHCEEEKDHLRMLYDDDGIGIPRAEKKKIFKEGYGKGTGYGLYLIRKMCEVYGWTINETGKQGKGAQFTITIPKMNEKGEMNYILSN